MKGRSEESCKIEILFLDAKMNYNKTELEIHGTKIKPWQNYDNKTEENQLKKCHLDDDVLLVGFTPRRLDF